MTSDAIDSWLGEQRSRLIRTAHSILRDRDEAEDVVQQTMLAVWQRAQRQPIAKPAAYLSRAVYWNALKRRARRHSEIPLDAIAEPAAGTVEDSIDAFELERAIAELSQAQQTVIRLRFYLGLSFREIAGCTLAIISAVVGITIPTAVRGAIAMPAAIPNCCAPEREAEQDEVENETGSST
jgi:RNA polymerase sigma-70 factor (ECF subfamily)